MNKTTILDIVIAKFEINQEAAQLVLNGLEPQQVATLVLESLGSSPAPIKEEEVKFDPFTKSTDVEVELPTDKLRYQPQDDDLQKEIAAARTTAAKVRRVFQHLGSGNTITLTELSKHVNVDADKLRKVCNQMLRSEEIDRVSRGTYALV